MASAIASMLCGSKYSPPSPTISGIELLSLHSTGHPEPMASSGGMPNPSYSEG